MEINFRKKKEEEDRLELEAKLLAKKKKKKWVDEDSHRVEPSSALTTFLKRP